MRVSVAWLAAALLGGVGCTVMMPTAWAQLPDAGARAEALPMADDENPCGSDRARFDPVLGRVCAPRTASPMMADLSPPGTNLPGTPCVLPEPVAPPGLQYQEIPGASPVCGPLPQTKIDPDDVARFVPALIDRYVAYGLVAGAAVAVVQNGEIIFKYGAGYADTARKEKVDPDRTLFRVGSISKMFTWTAAMQLQEQGKLKLDADVNDYLTAFRIPDTFPQPVTMKNLMTHTGGFEDNKWDYMLEADPQHLLPLEKVLASHIPARIWPPTTDFADGRHASYSNWGAALAGYLVQEISGQPFAEYMERNVFEPLGMSRSTFREPVPAALQDDVAKGYTYLDFAKPQPFEYFSGIAPAGSLSTTAADMARFMIAQLQLGQYGDRRILDAQTARLMQSRALSPSPYVNGSGYGYFETYVNGWRTIGHGGKTVNFRAEMTLIPQASFGVFVVYNTMPPTDVAKGFVNAVLNRYFPATLPDVPPPPDFARRAQEYVGSYGPNSRSYTKSEGLFEMSWGFDVVATPDNTLWIKGAEWVEVAPDTFRRIDGQDTLTFLRDEHGKVSHLVGPQAFNPAYKLPPRQANAAHAVALAMAAISTWTSAFPAPPLSWAIVLLGLLMLTLAFAPRLSGGANPLPAARWLAVGVGVLNLLMVAVLVKTLSDLLFRFAMLLTEIPWYLQATPLLFATSALATIAMGYVAFRAWRAGAWSLYARAEYTVLFVASVAFLIWLYGWQILHPA
ncbi:serine hydrolase domain-containing protein [Fontimonas sp. SYSU GA230001]|uniref:serine hydrolase domain-containing protein n=1 Tax=Fontimonas sp. SYSU GA230001 TaxID=3142450 RepID=UPI0032B59B7F